jgi:hypothetical protein
MDFQACVDAITAAAQHSDPEAANRILILFVAPGDAGLYVARVERGADVIGGPGVEDGAAGFRRALMRALGLLWPECSQGTRDWLEMGIDWLARSPIAKRLVAGGVAVGNR